MKRRTYLTSATTVSATLLVAGCTAEQPTEDDVDANETDDDSVDDEDEYETEQDDAEDDDDEDDDDEDDEDEDDGDEDEHSDLVGTFDDFEDLDAWEGFIGSIEANPDASTVGSQSALLQPNEADGQVRVRRELDEPIDVRDVTPGLAMASGLQGTVLIQLQDDDGDYVEYSQGIGSGGPFARHNFGPTRIRGDPDPSEVTLLQIVRWFGEDVEGEMWVDDFHFVPRVNAGKVMLQFHGGFETHYTQGLSILESYDLPGTVFVPTARIRSDAEADGTRLTIDQLEELDAAGWTIGSYGARGLHLDSVDPDELESDVLDPMDWLEDHGYADDGRFFAFPGSRYPNDAYDLVSEHYDLAFAGQSPSQGYAGNPHLCSVTPTPDAGDAIDLLDWTAELGGITTIPFYRLQESETIEALETTASHLSDLVEAGELDVLTPDEMVSSYVSDE